MKIGSVLVVCIGNICRSPLGERMLQSLLDESGASIRVESAGLHAVVGHGADSDASTVANEHGISLEGHKARQFTKEMGSEFDLILVMEEGHKAVLANTAPAASGKVFLFDQWSGAKGIADPHKRSLEFHEAVFGMVREGATGWAGKLAKSNKRRG